MALFGKRQIETFRREIAEANARHEAELNAFRSERAELSARISEMAQVLIAPETVEQEYTGNEFPTYEAQVAEIDAMYGGRAKWGGLMAGNIIDFRAAFTVGSGVKVKAKEGGEKEAAFIDAMFKWNDFTRTMLQELAKEAEMEGKLLLTLAFRKRDEIVSDAGDAYPGIVIVRHHPWLANPYTVKTNPDDYLENVSVSWKPKDGANEVTMKPPLFVYRRFGGRVSTPNTATPKIAKCLTQIQNIEKALRDWREINRIFGAPTPHIECQTKNDAQEMQAQVNLRNFKLKKFIAHVGKFDYASPQMTGAMSIKDEIVTLAKFISGTTGVPVHFLGLPDLMSNRATADNLFELVFSSTQKERETWKGLLSELADAMVDVYNAESQMTRLRKGMVEVDIPFISREQWDRIVGVWLPLFQAKAIDMETLLSKIPEVDAEGIKDRMEAAALADFEKMKEAAAEAQAEADRISAEKAAADKSAGRGV